MVTYTQIKSSNSLLTSSTLPQTSLFVGGTSGLGKFALKALVSASSVIGDTPIRIYLIGRQSSRPQTEIFISSLQQINHLAEIIFLEAEISLLSEVKRVCSHLLTNERSLDLLFLSAGYAPLSNTRQETSEGLEIAQSLEYYSRILFIKHLLPLLTKAKGRVVSILGGGLERPTSIPDVDDLGFKKGGKGMMGHKAQGQYVAMLSLGMEMLAREKKDDVVLLHSWPGIVSTGNVWRGIEDKNSWLGWFVWLILEPMINLIGKSEEEAGDRFLFQCTSGLYGGNGTEWNGKDGECTEGGLFLVNYNCDCTPNEKNLTVLREKAQEKVWRHTMDILGPYL